jgi:S-adenosylmethionine:tRNA ribosyltransferase-isomerase
VAERLSDYDYPLPPAAIAQRPLADRAACRLLVLDTASGALADRRFRALPALLASGDLLVVNDTRVLPARLRGRRERAGAGEAELLLHTPGADGRWLGLLRPARRFRPGDHFLAAAGSVRIQVEEAGSGGDRWLRLLAPASWAAAMALAGELPLPPYIVRPADARDDEDYQTPFARAAGAVAAPTAGLHFDPPLLAALAARGVAVAALTLHVGIGTFQPVRVDDPAEHRMHAERFTLPAATRRAVDAARAAGGRVIAVGTTVARTLESPSAADWAGPGDLIGETRLFIRPPYRCRRLDGLITNFHLPRSTLLMLVAALAGRERVLAAYAHAVLAGYRFFSYGDAMLLLPGAPGEAPR